MTMRFGAAMAPSAMGSRSDAVIYPPAFTFFATPRRAVAMGLTSYGRAAPETTVRSEEHTSELQSLMRISYAVFCLKKKNKEQHKTTHLRHYVTPILILNKKPNKSTPTHT